MADTIVNISFVVGNSGASIDALMNESSSTSKNRNLNGIANLVSALQAGSRNLISGKVDIATQCQALVTCTGTPVADETITINGVVFTAKASGTVANTFVLSATASVNATNLASAINASTSDGIAKTVIATSLAGVVTITSLVSGYASLGFTISESMTGTAVTSWATTTKTAYYTV